MVYVVVELDSSFNNFNGSGTEKISIKPPKETRFNSREEAQAYLDSINGLGSIYERNE